MDAQSIWYAVAVLLVLLGLAGILLPAIPGLPLVFLGMLVAAWAGGFEQVGGWTLLVLAILTLVSIGIDFLASAAGARKVGASRLAVAGALLGTIVGLFFGFVGVFVGPFVGAVAGELAARRGVGHGDIGQATKVGIGTWFGLFVGIVLKLTLAFAMIGIFALAWFTD
ncbi:MULTISPECIES: DUF456 domain-containing protein [Luteimonas]|jgi:uncharacterized protein YqgC (DUF456 family)|uniref:DUF456 domain-containing protein n=1 Tax=Luteimonas wenzhouensis TaxID=2599615 RepID=A0A5C5U7K6_9GAMM|nr:MULTISPECIES: DUF456 domain-containing protein [Luteimonas]TWT21789.1 DUF456 domain-containing protein [Luteimonas wenzhouensis]